MPSQSIQFSASQRAFAVSCFLTTKSVKQTQNLYGKEYHSAVKNKRKKLFPSKKSIYKWVKDFKKFGTVENKNSRSKYRDTNSGPKFRQRTLQNIEAVQRSLDTNEKMSIRRRSSLLTIPRETLRLILKKDLKLKAHK